MNARFVMFLVTTGFSLSAFGAADLVPDVTQLLNGTIRVVNQGADASGASQLTIVCQKQGGGSCPDAPGLVAYENAAYPNAVTVSVPPLASGSDHSHALAFWGELNWTPGTYNLTVSVDAGGVIVESNEANNNTVAQKVVLPAVAHGGGSKIGGFAAAPAKSRPAGNIALAGQPAKLPGAGKLVAGLPDLMATTLGFAIGGGFVSWGGSVMVSQATQVTSIKAGPNKNLCLVKSGLYRTFNKGAFAANNFIDVVTRNGTPIYTRQVASLGPQQFVDFENHDLLLQEGHNQLQVKIDAGGSVAESDESNTYSVSVNVKYDCNGDGVVAGSTPQIKSPSSPGTTPRKLDPLKTPEAPRRSR